MPRQLYFGASLVLPDSASWPPHGIDRKRRHLMCTLHPLVARVLSFVVKGQLEERSIPELFVQRLAHGGSLHPAFEVQVVGTRDTDIH